MFCVQVLVHSSWKEGRAAQAEGSAALSPPDFSSREHSGLQPQESASGSPLCSAVGSPRYSHICHLARSACSRSSEGDISSVSASGFCLWSLSSRCSSGRVCASSGLLWCRLDGRNRLLPLLAPSSWSQGRRLMPSASSCLGWTQAP